MLASRTPRTPYNAWSEQVPPGVLHFPNASPPVYCIVISTTNGVRKKKIRDPFKVGDELKSRRGMRKRIDFESFEIGGAIPRDDEMNQKK